MSDEKTAAVFAWAQHIVCSGFFSPAEREHVRTMVAEAEVEQQRAAPMPGAAACPDEECVGSCWRCDVLLAREHAAGLAKLATHLQSELDRERSRADRAEHVPSSPSAPSDEERAQRFLYPHDVPEFCATDASAEALAALLATVRRETVEACLRACEEEIASYDSGTSPRYASGVRGAAERIRGLGDGIVKGGSDGR